MTTSTTAPTASTASTTPRLAGVFAALPTPFDAAGALFPAAVAPLLDHVAALGCHGALLAGSTGEGPSLAHEERITLIAAAAAWRARRPVDVDAPHFVLLCGSGVPAWPDAARATAAVIDAGADAAVVLPPYFFKGVGEDGLFDWFRRVIDGAGRLLGGDGGGASGDGGVAASGRRLRVLAYDIPRHTGVPIPTAVLARLRAEYGPDGPFVGLKDSTGDAALTRERVAALPGAAVFTGTDTHLRTVLDAGGAGSITALASVRGDLARRVWDAHAAGGRGSGGEGEGADDVERAQADLDAARAALDRWPAVQAIKAALAVRLGGEGWWVRAPLCDLSAVERGAAIDGLGGAPSPGALRAPTPPPILGAGCEGGA